MADKMVVDNRWLDVVEEFRRTHKGRNPNTYEIEKLKAALNNN